MRSRLYSSPAIKTPPPPSFPAPAAPPPSYPAPNPPAEYDDDDDSNALYARPEPTGGGRAMSNPHPLQLSNLEEARKKSATMPVKASPSYGGPRSPAALGPLPELPKVTSFEQPKKDEEPGYDTTESVTADLNYDHLASGRFIQTCIYTHSYAIVGIFHKFICFQKLIKINCEFKNIQSYSKECLLLSFICLLNSCVIHSWFIESI